MHKYLIFRLRLALLPIQSHANVISKPCRMYDTKIERPNQYTSSYICANLRISPSFSVCADLLFMHGHVDACLNLELEVICDLKRCTFIHIYLKYWGNDPVILCHLKRLRTFAPLNFMLLVLCCLARTWQPLSSLSSHQPRCTAFAQASSITEWLNNSCKYNAASIEVRCVIQFVFIHVFSSNMHVLHSWMYDATGSPRSFELSLCAYSDWHGFQTHPWF
jgi:hypothetical protein